MKREEHYCDRCGTQMTEQDHEGDTNVVGLTVLGYKPEAACATNISLVVDSKFPHSCGYSSARQQLKGSEFCGVKCFTEAMESLIKDVQAYAAQGGNK
jgi:hypothetical protein